MKQSIKKNYLLEEKDKKEIKKQLIDLDLSMRQLAKNMGYHHTYLYDVFNGNKHISKKLIEALKTQGIVVEVN